MLERYSDTRYIWLNLYRVAPLPSDPQLLPLDVTLTHPAPIFYLPLIRPATLFTLTFRHRASYI